MKIVVLREWNRELWVEWEVGVGWQRYGWIMKVAWWRSADEGRWQGQKEPMEMQIAALNSIASFSFDVK